MAKSGIILEDFEITVLGNSSDTASCHSLYTLTQGRRVVIDLWTTKCVKCPAALEKLNRLALEFPDVLFIACVLNDKEMAEEIIEENEWGNMTHVFVELAIKESLKAQFSFSEVPFCLVIDSAHIVQAFGNPKNLNLPEILKVGSETGGVAETSANSLTTNVFSSDDF